MAPSQHRSCGAAALSSDRRLLLTGEDSTSFVWVPKDTRRAHGCRHRALPIASGFWGGSTFPSLILCLECFPLKCDCISSLISSRPVSLHQGGHPRPPYLRLQASHSTPLPCSTSLALTIMFFINLSCLLSVSHQQNISPTRAGTFISFVHY